LISLEPTATHMDSLRGTRHPPQGRLSPPSFS